MPTLDLVAEVAHALGLAAVHARVIALAGELPPDQRPTFPLPLSADGNPPTEILMFAPGDNPTVKGVFKFTKASAAAVMAEYQLRGFERLGDYDHESQRQATPDAPAPLYRPASCTFAIELRETPDGPALWATNIRWTPRAAGFIAGKEYRHWSQAFLVNDKNEVTRFINFALTNDPASIRQPPLVAASGGGLGEAGELVLCAGGPVPYQAAPIDDGPWDAAAAIERLRKWAGVDGDNPTAAEWRRYGEGFAYISGDGNKLGDFHLPHHDLRDGKFVTVRAGVIAAGNSIQGSRGQTPNIPPGDLPGVKRHLEQHYHQFDATAPWEADHKESNMAQMNKLGEYMGKKMTALNLSLKQLADEAKMPEPDLAKLMSTDEDPTKPMRAKLKALAGALKVKVSTLRALADGDEPDADDEDGKGKERVLGLSTFHDNVVQLAGAQDDGAALVALREGLEIAKEVKALTGKASKAEIVAVIASGQSAKEQVVVLSGRVEAIERATKETTEAANLKEFDALIKLAVEGDAEGKVKMAPAFSKGTLVAGWRASAYQTGKARGDGLVSLTTYLAEQAPIMTLDPARCGTAPGTGGPVVPPADGVVTLSAEEKKACQQFGTSEADFLKHKKEILAGGGVDAVQRAREAQAQGE